jgi:hypothetical protein
MMNLKRWFSSFSICLRYSRYLCGFSSRYFFWASVYSKLAPLLPAQVCAKPGVIQMGLRTQWYRCSTDCGEEVKLAMGFGRPYGFHCQNIPFC